jgi:hypothetical protein
MPHQPCAILEQLGGVCVLDEAITKFNARAEALQTTEFRVPRTPGEWQRIYKSDSKKDYSKLLNAVQPFIQAVALADPAERDAVASRLSLESIGILRTFAHAASVLAVRRESPSLIGQGLVALVIFAQVDDLKDVLFYLATLYHSTTKLGLDAQTIFREAASLTSSPVVRRQIEGFPLRSPDATNLRAFNLRETTTKEGFDYIQDPL